MSEEEYDADSDQDAADQGCQKKNMMLTPIKMLRIKVVRTQDGAECHNDDHIEESSSTDVIKNAIPV